MIYKSVRRTACCVLAGLGLAVLAACGGKSDSSGHLKLGITDAPVDNARRVVVQFTGVELQPRDGTRLNFDFDTPRQIDLLALSGVDSETLLDGVVVPPGPYVFVRLKVNTSRTGLESFIELNDGSQHPLFIPSGAESGLKLNGGVEVPAGGQGAFTIDFDLRKSVHEPQNAQDAYFLRPALRLVNDLQIGAIRGAIDPALATAAGCTPAVYVYVGSGATPDDVASANEPINSARVSLNTTNGAYEYVVGFLPAGAYTVAFTCDAAADDPETDDPVVFSAPKDASVMVGSSAVVNFP